jgi:hypothetical protein
MDVDARFIKIKDLNVVKKYLLSCRYYDGEKLSYYVPITKLNKKGFETEEKGIKTFRKWDQFVEPNFIAAKHKNPEMSVDTITSLVLQGLTYCSLDIFERMDTQRHGDLCYLGLSERHMNEGSQVVSSVDRKETFVVCKWKKWEVNKHNYRDDVTHVCDVGNNKHMPEWAKVEWLEKVELTDFNKYER